MDVPISFLHPCRAHEPAVFPGGRRLFPHVGSFIPDERCTLFKPGPSSPQRITLVIKNFSSPLLLECPTYLSRPGARAGTFSRDRGYFLLREYVKFFPSPPGALHPRESNAIPGGRIDFDRNSGLITDAFFSPLAKKPSIDSRLGHGHLSFSFA